MKTACYLRFSSDNQKETSIDDQLRNVEQFCARQGWPKPAIYKDAAITGARNDRPGYLAMLKAAQAKQFDVLVVDDLSRLSRDELENGKAIRTLKYLEVRVVGVSDGIDTDRDTYKIETGMRGLMNALYLDDLSKKSKRGLVGQVLRGYSPGRFPYGYKSEFDGKGYIRTIDEERAQWVRYIFTRYGDGATTRQIAKELNSKNVPSPSGRPWRHSTFEPNKGSHVGMLGNQIYIGVFEWKKTKRVHDPITNQFKQVDNSSDQWMIQQVPHLRIVTDEQWELVQKRIQRTKERNIKRNGGRPSTNLFHGLLRCGVCGAKYVLKNKHIYGCANTVDRDSTACTNRINIKYTILEERLLEGIKKDLLTDEAFREFEIEAKKLLVADLPDTAPISSRLLKAQKELDNLMMAIRAGVVTVTTKAAVEEAEQKIQALQAELKSAKAFRPEEMLPFARKVYEDMVTKLGNVENIHLAREALRDLIGVVTLHPQPEKELVAEFEHGSLSSAMSEMLPFPPLWTHFLQKGHLTIHLK